MSPRSGAQTPEVTFLGAQSPLQGGGGWGGLQPQAIQKTLKREHSVPRTNLLSPVAHFSPHPELAAQSPNPTEEAPQRLRGQGTRRPAPKATRAQGTVSLLHVADPTGKNPEPPGKCHVRPEIRPPRGCHDTLEVRGPAQRSGRLGAVTTHWGSEAQPPQQRHRGLDGAGCGAHVAGSEHSRLSASGSLLWLPWEAKAADPISQGRKLRRSSWRGCPLAGVQGTGNLRAGHLPTTKRPLERSARTFRQVAVEYTEPPAPGGGGAQALGSEVRGLGSSPDVPLSGARLHAPGTTAEPTPRVSPRPK